MPRYVDVVVKQPLDYDTYRAESLMIWIDCPRQRVRTAWRLSTVNTNTITANVDLTRSFVLYT